MNSNETVTVKLDNEDASPKEVEVIYKDVVMTVNVEERVVSFYKDGTETPMIDLDVFLEQGYAATYPPVAVQPSLLEPDWVWAAYRSLVGDKGWLTLHNGGHYILLTPEMKEEFGMPDELEVGTMDSYYTNPTDEGNEYLFMIPLDTSGDGLRPQEMVCEVGDASVLSYYRR